MMLRRLKSFLTAAISDDASNGRQVRRARHFNTRGLIWAILIEMLRQKAASRVVESSGLGAQETLDTPRATI